MTPRETVFSTLDFSRPPRVPRQIWTLPVAAMRYEHKLDELRDEFPDDIVTAPEQLSRPTAARGDPYRTGTYIDDWGASFVQVVDGIIGEVKCPIVNDDTWQDTSQVHVPVERLTFDREAVRAFCASTDRFVLTPLMARPFEQLQFLRGTEDLFVDLTEPPPALLSFIDTMQAFYAELTEAWAKTEVDGIVFIDDWGSQNALLVNPEMWRALFKPLYREYVHIAHRYGKRAFMHSDGNILAILPDLIEIGLDALNSQLFCMGLTELSQWAGRITFWGEIDRQHLLVEATENEVRSAVRAVRDLLYREGGCIAQCEFGAGARLENVRAVFDEWNRLSTPRAD